MWTVPGAQLRHIANTSLGVRDKTLGLILHVQVGYGVLTDWYDNPGSEASSAWQAMRDGTVYQFGDPDVDKFWTQAAGNPDYGAVETEGRPEDPLTDAQIDACARIYAAGHLHEGWPFRLAEKPGERGLGWHGMGGVAWGNHPFCPGTLRKNQRPEILRRAQALINPVPEEDDMQLDDHVPTSATEKRVWGIDDLTVGHALKSAEYARIFANDAKKDAASALEVIKALAAKGGMSTADIEAAAARGAAKALDDKIAGADVTLNVNQEK